MGKVVGKSEWNKYAEKQGFFGGLLLGVSLYCLMKANKLICKGIQADTTGAVADKIANGSVRVSKDDAGRTVFDYDTTINDI